MWNGNVKELIVFYDIFDDLKRESQKSRQLDIYKKNQIIPDLVRFS